MPSEAKQRFLDLDVAEISLVDTPANEVEFLVLKRLSDTEDEPMANQSTTTTVEQPTTKAAAAPAAGAEVVALEAPATDAGNETAVNKALAQVTALVQSIATTVQATKAQAAAEVLETDAEKAKKKGNPMREMYSKALEKAGTKGDELAKAMEAFDAEAAKSAGEASTAKSIEHSAEDTQEQAAEKALEALSNAVSKAKKFTPKREAALKSAIDGLSTLLAEISSANASAPAATSGDLGESGLIGLTKALTSLTEQVTKGLAEVQETTKGLITRVESVEKARLPSTALPEDTTEKPVDVKKSFWNGVL